MVSGVLGGLGEGEVGEGVVGGGEVSEGAGRVAEGLTRLKINSFSFVLYRYDIHKLVQTVIGPTLGLK